VDHRARPAARDAKHRKYNRQGKMSLHNREYEIDEMSSNNVTKKVNGVQLVKE
jgi:hypothetical protein